MNDTNTLNGALMELGETLADNLVAKGVSASASDGLTTLANKVLDIQQGGSCYHIELDESAYTTTGSLTVTATLQNQYQPYANQTITFTGGTSTVTATTDSNGVATATVTFNSSGTLTASYSNVSDTATVTVQTSYLFYDACDSSTGLSNYGSVYSLEGNAQATLTYDSTMNSYKVQSNGSGAKVFPITALTGLDSLRLSADVYVSSSVNSGTSIGLACVGTNHSGQGWCVFPTQTCYVHVFNNNSFSKNVSLNTSTLANEWINITLDVQGTSVGYTITKVTDGTVVKTGTWSLTKYSSNYATLTDRQYAIDIGWSRSNCYAYIKNIIAEPI